MHDLGTGTYTVMQQVAADALGLAPDKVTVRLGDTRLPASHAADRLGDDGQCGRFGPAGGESCARQGDRARARLAGSALRRRDAHNVVTADGSLRLARQEPEYQLCRAAGAQSGFPRSAAKRITIRSKRRTDRRRSSASPPYLPKYASTPSLGSCV